MDEHCDRSRGAAVSVTYVPRWVFCVLYGVQFWLDEWLVAVRAMLRCARLVNHLSNTRSRIHLQGDDDALQDPETSILDSPHWLVTANKVCFFRCPYVSTTIQPVF